MHQNVLIRVLGLIILLLLFVDMANSEPNVSFCQRGRRVVKNVFKALERQLVLEQLLVCMMPRRNSDFIVTVILFYFILFYFILFYFILFYFILFYFDAL